MHQNGYNEMWGEFLQGLERRGVTGNEARRQVLDFIKNDVQPAYAKYGMTPVPWR